MKSSKLCSCYANHYIKEDYNSPEDIGYESSSPRLFGLRGIEPERSKIRLTIPPGQPLPPPRSKNTKLNDGLHQLLNYAGFTHQRAVCEQQMADFLEKIAQGLTKDGRQMTGSYTEGWANSLVQVNGKTGADSDINWTIMDIKKKIHLNGSCDGIRAGCKDAIKCIVSEGNVKVALDSGNQPSLTVKACGLRPSQDTCYALQCCSWVGRQTETLKQFQRGVHLAKATGPNAARELSVSFSFTEKYIMRSLNTIQGQLFTLIKFIFKIHLPYTLDTPGLKTYHAKTLLFFMLEKHGKDNQLVWQPQNLVTLLKGSLKMMLKFIGSSSSPGECMPHFFMDDALLYFSSAEIGGDFRHIKSRVQVRLSGLISSCGIGFFFDQIRKHIRVLESQDFYFHPFTLLPLTTPFVGGKVRDCETNYDKCVELYSVVYQCISDLQSDSCSKDTLMRQLSLLQRLQWCKCAVLCMTSMTHLKFKERAEAERVMRALSAHCVKNGWPPNEFAEMSDGHSWYPNSDSDWAWRFCLPCNHKPHFPFLPEFTQTLFTARLQQPASSHLYVNFRCLSWSLQAELLQPLKNGKLTLESWLEETQHDADLEELLTVAHYSESQEQLKICLDRMETIRVERRIVMEKEDEEKIRKVSEKFSSLSPTVEDDSDLKLIAKDYQSTEDRNKAMEAQDTTPDTTGVQQAELRECPTVSGQADSSIRSEESQSTEHLNEIMEQENNDQAIKCIICEELPSKKKEAIDYSGSSENLDEKNRLHSLANSDITKKISEECVLPGASIKAINELSPSCNRAANTYVEVTTSSSDESHESQETEESTETSKYSDSISSEEFKDSASQHLKLFQVDSSDKFHLKLQYENYDKQVYLTNFTYCLSNVQRLDQSLRDYHRISLMISNIIVPSIRCDGSYGNKESDPHQYFDIWGEDSKCGLSIIRGRSAVEQMTKFPSKKTYELLQKQWESRQSNILDKCKPLLYGDEKEMEITDKLTALANNIADSTEQLSEEDYGILLHDLAAIVRGRIEAQLVTLESRVICPITEGWFCVMMAVWSRLRIPERKSRQKEAEEFEKYLKKYRPATRKDVNVRHSHWYFMRQNYVSVIRSWLHSMTKNRNLLVLVFLLLICLACFCCCLSNSYDSLLTKTAFVSLCQAIL